MSVDVKTRMRQARFCSKKYILIFSYVCVDGNYSITYRAQYKLYLYVLTGPIRLDEKFEHAILANLEDL